MSVELQERAKAFLARPIPAALDYVGDSIAERIIALYARDGSLGDDRELAELLELVVMETPIVAETKTGEARTYLTESADILTAIAEERG